MERSQNRTTRPNAETTCGFRTPITRLRHVALGMPNFTETVDFYRSKWGLELVAEDTDVAFFGTVGHRENYVLRIRRALEKRIDLIAFAVTAEHDVDLLAERVIAVDGTIDREPGPLDTPGGGYGFRFFDIDGRLIEISADVIGRPARELAIGESVPKKLSHVVVNSPNLEATRRYYQRVLGFRVSDWLDDKLCFLRVRSDHHILGIAHGPHASLNHVSFEMRGTDEFLRGTGRLTRLGTAPLWGPGRHSAGDNTFSYFADPVGNIVEYTTELERVIDEETWIPRRFTTAPEHADQWGTAGSPEVLLPQMANDPDTGLWVPAPL